MNDIAIRYKFGLKNFLLKKATATCWDELTDEQMFFLVNLQKKTDDAQKLIDSITLNFIGKLPKTFPGFSRADLNRLNNLHMWTFEHVKMIRNIVPTLEVQGVKLYGPSDACANTVFIEFLKANKYYSDFVKSKDEMDLNLFVATLYRKRNPKYKALSLTDDGDPRVRFNAHLIEHDATLVAKIPYEQKHAVCLFWQGCISWMQVHYESAFHKGGQQVSFGNIGIIDSLAGSKWGKPAEVEFEYTHRILAGICRTIQENEKNN